MSFGSADVDNEPAVVTSYKKGNIFSNDLSMAVSELRRRYPHIAEKFQPILDGLHTGNHVYLEGNNSGFNARQSVGVSLSMALFGQWTDKDSLSPSNITEWLDRSSFPLSITDPELHQRITAFYNESLKPLCVTKLFHASPNLFDRPDPNKISETASNQHGWGFYTAFSQMSAGDNVEGHPDAIFYSIEVENKDLEKRWLKQFEPIGLEIYNRFLEASLESPILKDFMESRDITPFTNGDIISTIARENHGGKGPKAGASLLSSLDIDGYIEGAYALFYKPENVVLKPDWGWGKFAPTAEEEALPPESSGYRARISAMLSPVKNEAEIVAHGAFQNKQDIIETSIQKMPRINLPRPNMDKN